MAIAFRPGMSLAETTTNSFQGTAGGKLRWRMLPRGIWLRTVAPYNMLGKVRSSMYWERPVTLSRPSLRGVAVPTIGSDFMKTLRLLYRAIGKASALVHARVLTNFLSAGHAGKLR